VEFPERAVPVQQVGVHSGQHFGQLLVVAGAGQNRVANVVIDFEVTIGL